MWVSEVFKTHVIWIKRLLDPQMNTKGYLLVLWLLLDFYDAMLTNFY